MARKTHIRPVQVLGAAVMFAALAGLCIACRKSTPAPEVRKGAFWCTFGGPNRLPGHLSPHIAYDLVPASERFFVYVPSGYTGAEAYGLIVFTYADPSARLPAGWQSVLDRRKYIFVAAQNAGNDQPRGRRLGLAVMAAQKAMKIYHIDPARVYAAGFSGGARMSGLLGFYQPDIFRGTLQNCGADFYKSVPIVDAISQVDTAGHPYGLLEASSEDISSARNVRFVLITGTNDFRHGNILDVFHGGFEREGFQAKLFDVPGMEHDIGDGETLAHALDFLEGAR